MTSRVNSCCRARRRLSLRYLSAVLIHSDLSILAIAMDIGIRPKNPVRCFRRRVWDMELVNGFARAIMATGLAEVRVRRRWMIDGIVQFATFRRSGATVHPEADAVES